MMYFGNAKLVAALVAATLIIGYVVSIRIENTQLKTNLEKCAMKTAKIESDLATATAMLKQLRADKAAIEEKQLEAKSLNEQIAAKLGQLQSRVKQAKTDGTCDGAMRLLRNKAKGIE